MTEEKKQAIVGKIMTILFVGLVVFIIAHSCRNDKKPCPECPDCPECPKVDSSAICQACADDFRQDALAYWDSIKQVRTLEIDTLLDAAIQEATAYRENAIYQVDTMRDNYLAWCADTIQGINDYFDSLKDLKVYDNMIYYGDSLNPAKAEFDSITGKPKLIFN